MPNNSMPEIVALKALIKKLGLSLSDFKEEIGTKGYVSMVLSGQRKLSKSHIEKICNRFKLNPSTFFDISEATILAGRRKPVPRRNLFDPSVEPEEAIEDRLLANVIVKANKKTEQANKNLLKNLHLMIQTAVSCES